MSTPAPPRIPDQHLPADRRRNGRSGQTPADALKDLPALVILERIPIAAFAMDRAGTILFANTAFAALVGFTPDELMSLTFDQIAPNAPAEQSVAALGGCADRIELTHADGWTVQTRMSRSTLWRTDDTVVLVTVDDLTDQLWLSEP